ncbi:hypothetical protein BDQ94DRAFT_163701 [Aspergillus welwitschiae]|uniref:Uncharacterized protein n=1 Tax=Aspergillus welwitschiae TaxID=1341132 RepID=A0A3F3PKA8_9EURO|nr:hypothetical protein BDQ94DRAFT_163701 [Aspergillus welwitschiae]RDH27307.1 hypothetical protein BDQ94DRAFT_163701 [Aspergillus welwitschiae]
MLIADWVIWGKVACCSLFHHPAIGSIMLCNLIENGSDHRPSAHGAMRRASRFPTRTHARERERPGMPRMLTGCRAMMEPARQGSGRLIASSVHGPMMPIPDHWTKLQPTKYEAGPDWRSLFGPLSVRLAQAWLGLDRIIISNSSNILWGAEYPVQITEAHQ